MISATGMRTAEGLQDRIKEFLVGANDSID